MSQTDRSRCGNCKWYKPQPKDQMTGREWNNADGWCTNRWRLNQKHDTQTSEGGWCDKWAAFTPKAPEKELTSPDPIMEVEPDFFSEAAPADAEVEAHRRNYSTDLQTAMTAARIEELEALSRGLYDNRRTIALDLARCVEQEMDQAKISFYRGILSHITATLEALDCRTDELLAEQEEG